MWEWNDAIISQYRGRRGGTSYQGSGFMQASSRYTSLPDTEHHDIGFRIATVPEPTATVSLILGVGMLLARRKRPSAL